MTDPSLTVFIPSYNYAEYLEEAICSVLDQEYADLELLIIDDGSTDASPQMIEAYAKKDPRIRAIFHKHNRGLMAIINDGIQLARGKYVHFLSADDKRLPTYFSEMMRLVDLHPEAAVYVSDFGYFHDDSSEEIKTWPLIADASECQHYPPEKVVSMCQKTTFWIPGHTSIVKREAIVRFGGFDTQLKHLCDWFLLHAIAMNEGAVYLPKTLALMRFHKKTYTKNQTMQRKDLKRTYRYALQKLSACPRLRAQFKRSTLLTFIFKDLFWKLLFNLRYTDFWPYINLKYSVKGRIISSIRKKFAK